MHSIEKFKVIIGASTIIISIISILIYYSPTKCYELSIYTETPLIWFLLLINNAIGISILVYYSDKKYKNAMCGFCILLLNNFLIISMHSLRGYYLHNPVDPFAHLGWVIDLLNQGYITNDNYYPSVHILFTILTHITDIDPIIFFRFIPSILTILYMVYMYLLADVIFEDKKLVLLTTGASSVLLFGFFHTSIYTQSFSILTFPLFLYLYFKDLKAPSIQFKIPLILLIFAYTYFHPHTALILIICLIIFEIGKVILKKTKMDSNLNVTNVSLLSIILMVSFVLWISSTELFKGATKTAFSVIEGNPLKPTQLSHGQIGIAIQLPEMDFYFYFLKSYGHILIYLSIVVIVSILMLYMIAKHKQVNICLLMLLVFCIFADIFMFIFFYLVRMQSVTRLIMTSSMILLSPLFVGYFLYYIKNKLKLSNKFNSFIIIIFLISASTLGVVSLYRSPFVYQANWQTTNSDIEGLDWLIKYKNTEMLYNALGMPHALVYDIVGKEVADTRSDIETSSNRVGYASLVDIPPHFGYQFWDTIAEAKGRIEYEAALQGEMMYPGGISDSYIIITDRFYKVSNDPILSEKRMATYIQLGYRYDISKNDIEKLENDPTMHYLYSNGYYSTYYLEIPTHEGQYYIDSIESTAEGREIVNLIRTQRGF